MGYIYRVYVIDGQGRRHLMDKTIEEEIIDLLIKHAWEKEAMRVDAVEVARAGDEDRRTEEVVYRGDRTADGRIVANTDVGFIRPIIED